LEEGGIVISGENVYQSSLTPLPPQPFLKWAGGKRWLVARYSSLFPSTYNRYIEPFLGGAAIFFNLQPHLAILSDKNKELIDCYMAIKTDWQLVREELAKHHSAHNKDYYYKIRTHRPTNLYQQAARFIYLNRTCWNGLYRVNLNGQFNVPIGTKSAVITESDNFLALSEVLANAEIFASDFEPVIDKAQKDDFLFIDPPYTIEHNLNGFIKYNEHLFSWDDQVRLRDSLICAKKRGAHIIVTNANHESVRVLYEADFELQIVSRHSVIAAAASKRKKCEELIIKG
jgi:DNA adenine methylase